MAKKIVLTGGGTVGHVTLNLLLIPLLLADGYEVHYIGDKRGVEYQQISQSGHHVTFHGIATGKLRRYFSLQNLMDIFKVAFGVLQSLVILARVRPQALFSKGGFVSVPPVVASRVLGIPVFIHESDLSMGLANKIALKFATKLYTTFEPEVKSAKVQQVGAVTKVAKQELTAEAEQALAAVQAHFDPTLKTLLFVGGSAGAKVFNDFVSQNLDLTKSYNVINLTGDSSLNSLTKNLYRLDYATDRYLPLLELADVVVTRGGSNTLFELVAMEKLHVIVPLGKAASRGDQLENAAYFEKKGYAAVLQEDELSLNRLQDMVNQLLSQETAYRSAMSQSPEITALTSFYGRLLTDMGVKHG